MAEHQLTLLQDEGSAISRCSCGWRTTPVRLPGHAEARWRIHVGERRAATAVAACRRLSAMALERSAELAVLREAARVRRAELQAQRERLRSSAATAAERAERPQASTDRVVLLRRAQAFAGLSLSALWLDYFALGGAASLNALDGMLAGRAPLSRREHDVLVTALNERFAEGGFGYPLDAWGEAAS